MLKHFYLVALLVITVARAVFAQTVNGGGNGGGGSVPGIPTAYLGQVATRSYVPMSFNGTNKQEQTRTTHYARSNINSLQIVIPNFYCNPGTGETAPGSTSSVTASVEYPAGTFTRIIFSGSGTGTIPNGGMLTSDATAVVIPYGAQFFIRIWLSNATGIVFWGTTGNSMVATDGFAFGVTTPDLTGGGAVSFNATTGFFPAAIIAQTTRPAIFLAGDSRVQGIQDTAGSYGDVGELARSVGPGLAYINAGCSGETQASANANYTNRLALSAYGSHVISNYGINDVTGGASAATVEASINTFIAKFSATKPVWIATLPPVSTSSDSWATTVNQTTNANNANRVTVNSAMRAATTIVGNTGYMEVAGAVESSLNSGLWATPGYTPDGTHETESANLKIMSLQPIPVWSLVR